ncbi:MAG: prepilin-type N-terminal cleavage/methylation domain-containing protein [Sedimentisphaerales bacterium]
MRTSVTKNGFTLPEVVVAAALLLIAIVPILKALTAANLDSVIIEKRTQSLYLAQEKLNQIKAKSIYDFNTISETDANLGNSYYCDVSQTLVSGNDYLKKVIVSVGLDVNRSGTLEESEKEVTLQTQIAKRWP